MKVKVAQLCLTLCSPMDYTVHGILQARILEWVAVPFSTGSSQPRDWTQVSHIAGRFFTSWHTRKAQEYWIGSLSLLQQIFPIQESNQGLLHCRQIFTSWATRKVTDKIYWIYYLCFCIFTSWIHNYLHSKLQKPPLLHVRGICQLLLSHIVLWPLLTCETVFYFSPSKFFLFSAHHPHTFVILYFSSVYVLIVELYYSIISSC